VIASQLSSIEINFDDKVRVLIVLFSLPDSWNITIITICNSFGSTSLTLHEVRDLILERTHKMLSSASMIKRFLVDVLSTTSYLMNRFPSIVIGCLTPKEVWLGNVVNYSIFKIFGCPCYA